MFLKFEPKDRHLYQYGHQIRSRLFINSADTDPTFVTEDMFHGVVTTLYHKFNWGSVLFSNQDLKASQKENVTKMMDAGSKLRLTEMN